eukprot:scaffold78041_cov60-Phaeocystis_antarctica.AAC.1
MAANLSHEPGPLGSQESQHELQEPQEISDSNDNDPNEPENKISWYIVEDGPYSMCIMGFNPEEANDFENDAAEDRTTFSVDLSLLLTWSSHSCSVSGWVKGSPMKPASRSSS